MNRDVEFVVNKTMKVSSSTSDIIYVDFPCITIDVVIVVVYLSLYKSNHVFIYNYASHFNEQIFYGKKENSF